MRRAPRGSHRALCRDTHAPDAGAPACVHAHDRRRRPARGRGQRGTRRRDSPSQWCHDRSVHLVRPCLPRHDPRRLARRSLVAGQRAQRRRGARRRVQPVRRPPCRPSRASGRDPGDAHARAAERLHADPARRGPTPFGRLAPLRRRSSGRRAMPSAGHSRSGSRRSVWPACSWRTVPSFSMGGATSAPMTTVGAPVGGAERSTPATTRRGWMPSAAAEGCRIGRSSPGRRHGRRASDPSAAAPAGRRARVSPPARPRNRTPRA